MPRPTTAQVAYGSLTVVLSTFAILLLTDADSGTGVVAVAAAGLVLGLVVAAVLAAPRRGSSPGPALAASAHGASSSVSAGSSASVPTATHGPVPRSRLRGGAVEPRVSEHSLRR
ncbi:MAG: hypothetical protein QOF98_895 [Streptomyces sp.]|jgi:hypothetical protein|nr:hypothetical protein [Streptomyces sp.]